MKIVQASEITQEVVKLSICACRNIPHDVFQAFQKAHNNETSPLGKEILSQLIENSQIAHKKQIPICQDTGMCVVFVELGQDVRVEGGFLEEAIQKGVALGYTEGFLRKSIVNDPLFDRKNTQDNAPAVIHYEIVEGDRLKIIVAPKGFGSENKSALLMLTPAQGLQGVKDFFIQTLENAGPNSCPPLLVGIGIGGTMEKAALLAKKAAIREVGSSNPDERYANLERELMELANSLGIGPQGLGGDTTVFGVNIEWYPTHIAGLPVAININCNAIRHTSIQF
ncbi:fumarate hydratase [Helicobacter kayseriensis]|uniref:fumarate hydratase n=1 Tax=Helicobacter kayseriensis TaxID=2905877 RepID=UPI001E63BE3C|nr:fumarate hydratase [Helicobacter kayseriensis]MCE3048924.1 fumarate hydratase [Helicobacter kayseriensis]